MATDAAESTLGTATPCWSSSPLSGFTSLALEVLWFRVLVLLVRPTVYGFAMMLAMLLFGIGVGSYLVTPLLQTRAAVAVDPQRRLSCCWPSSRFFRFRRWPITPPMVARHAVDRAVFPEYLAFSMVASFLSILPSALLLGIAFPIGLRFVDGRARRRPARMPGGGSDCSIPSTSPAASSDRSRRDSCCCRRSAAAPVSIAGLVCRPLLRPRPARLCRAGSAHASRPGDGVHGGVCLERGLRSPTRSTCFSKLRYSRVTRVLWREEGVQATVSINKAAGRHARDDARRQSPGRRRAGDDRRRIG